MLLKKETLDGIEAGSIRLVFRRWNRPSVKAGGAQRTRIGVLAIESVDVVAPSGIKTADAKAAGYESRAALLRDLESREGTIYRIAVCLQGEDPRIALRNTRVRAADLAELDARLDRMDAASRSGPWTRVYLDMIAVQPGVRAPDLAASIGLETKPFKQRVRRLKELGLTESLEVGYRLSPRGKSYLRKRG